MDFIERWLHISPDGGNGTSELLIATVVILTIIMIMSVALRKDFLRNFIDNLKQPGKRENSDRFDN
jgi:hypothetical protein